MLYDYEITTAPVAEPVSVSDLKEHLRVGHANDDPLLGSLIEMARLELERATGRAFVTQTRTLRLSRFPIGRRIYLPGDPVSSITSIKYYDSGGTQQTWSSVEYSLRQGHPSWVQLGFEYSWPSHRSVDDEVEIIYVCGQSVSAVDQRAKQAIKLRCQLDYAEQHAKEWDRCKDSYEWLKTQLNIGEEFLDYGC